MYDDDIFAEEVDEEAAAERAKNSSEGTGNANDNINKDSYNNSYTFNSSGSAGGEQRGDYWKEYQRNYYENLAYSTNGKAKKSLTLGIISLVFFLTWINLITAIISIISGIKYLRRGSQREGKAMAITGIVCSVLSVCLLFGAMSYTANSAAMEDLINDPNLEYFFEDGGYDDFDFDEDFGEEFFDDTQLHQDDDIESIEEILEETRGKTL